eukprot:13960-Heterococcus_DN1.PRE.2
MLLQHPPHCLLPLPAGVPRIQCVCNTVSASAIVVHSAVANAMYTDNTSAARSYALQLTTHAEKATSTNSCSYA